MRQNTRQARLLDKLYDALPINSMMPSLGAVLTFANREVAGKVARRSRNAARLSAGIRQQRR